MKKLTFFFALFLAQACFSQAQIRIDPDTVGGWSSQALPTKVFEVVCPGTYAIFGTSILHVNSYDEIGAGVFFTGSSVTSAHSYERIVSVSGSKKTANGNILIVGAKANLSNGLSDAVVVRLNAVGDTLWTRVFDSGYEEFFRGVDEAPDGSIYVVGNMRVSGYLQTIVCKLSSSGILLWQKQEAFVPFQIVPQGIFARGDSIIIFEQASNDILARVLDSNGLESMRKRFGDNSLNENVPNVAEKPDGGFVVYNGFTPLAANAPVEMIILDSSLNISLTASEKLSVSGKKMFAFTVDVDANGDIFLGGSIGQSGTNYGTISKYSNNHVVWTKTLSSYGAVTAQTHFEGGNVVVPTYGRSTTETSSFGVAVSFVSKTNGTLSGILCEEGLPTFSVETESISGLFEITEPSGVWTDIEFLESQGFTLSNLDILQTNCAGITLPIELVRFDARLFEQTVKLSFETASETGSDYFLIERSIDGESFEEVANLEAAGNSTRSRFYEAADLDPHGGLNYYRLREVDYDGQETISDVKVVDFHSLFVWPNPVRAGEKLHGIGDKAFELFDLNGRQVSSGQGIESLNVPPGTYLLRVGDEVIRLVVN